MVSAPTYLYNNHLVSVWCAGGAGHLEPKAALFLEEAELVHVIILDLREARLVSAATIPVLGPAYVHPSL
jgi:hypothetical protein